jgi:hypothetical protein
MSEPIHAHANNFHAQTFGELSWRPARPPVQTPGSRLMVAALRGCSYCGSMHPADLAGAIREGASIHWADRKYGWPHKVYAEGVPNPHAGMMEIRAAGHLAMRDSRPGVWIERPDGRGIEWHEEPQPASARTHGKFYTEHLQDATPQDKVTIERAMGLQFEFTDEGVNWKPFKEPGL